jgi:hypothetical protein
LFGVQPDREDTTDQSGSSGCSAQYSVVGHGDGPRCVTQRGRSGKGRFGVLPYYFALPAGRGNRSGTTNGTEAEELKVGVGVPYSWTGESAGIHQNKWLHASIVFLNSGLARKCSEFVDRVAGETAAGTAARVHASLRLLIIAGKAGLFVETGREHSPAKGATPDSTVKTRAGGLAAENDGLRF